MFLERIACWTTSRRFMVPGRASTHLELEFQRKLTGAVPSKIGTTGLADLPEVGLSDVELRVGQVGMVQNVGKRTFRAQPDPFRDHERFAQT